MLAKTMIRWMLDSGLKADQLHGWITDITREIDKERAAVAAKNPHAG